MEGVVREGIYVMVGGPNYETVAELKMLRALGVDSVGKKLLLFEYGATLLFFQIFFRKTMYFHLLGTLETFFLLSSCFLI